jgi:Domain of unknown function (DUF4136)
MKIKAAFWSFALIACLGLPAIVQAQKTSFDFEQSTIFAKFKTFRLVKGTPELEPVVLEPFLDKRIVASIESQLAARALARSDENPDVYVLYHVVLGVQKSLTGFGSGSGPFGWHGGFDTFDARLNDIPVGALVIDLANAATRELVWRGVGMNEIDVTAKPEKRDAAIDKAVEKILKNYPPKSGR